MIVTQLCKRENITGFLTNQLELDERLDFLGHLEECGKCWGEIYNARKAEHPHYYKRTSRQVKITDTELKKIDALAKEEPEAYQVA